MNNDRKQLIRLASKMPVGDEARRVILAELQKQAVRVDPALVRFWKQRIKRYGPFGDDGDWVDAAHEAAVDWFVEDNKKSGYKKHPYAADEVLDIAEPFSEEVAPQLLDLAKQWGHR